MRRSEHAITVRVQLVTQRRHQARERPVVAAARPGEIVGKNFAHERRFCPTARVTTSSSTPQPPGRITVTETSTIPVTAASLAVPGARLYYEVRGQGPLVVLVGAPMDARPFAPLADLLGPDHTVLTTDPRGINRSPVDDPSQD